MTELRALHSEKVGPALTGQRIDKPCRWEYQWLRKTVHAERHLMEREGWTFARERRVDGHIDTLWKRPKPVREEASS